MMSIERELLEKSMDALDQYWNDESASPETNVRKLYIEIDEFLSQPEQDPVAEKTTTSIQRYPYFR